MILTEKKIYLSAPHMTGNERKYIDQAFDTNWVAPLGPNVDEFEKCVAKYVGVDHALALNSGTAAIHLALKLCNVAPGDIVFCSTLTFVASVNPILYEKGIPVLIDSDEETWNMSPKALKKAFIEAVKNHKLPKAVIVVNLYGHSANMDEIIALCNQYDVPIIEDAAESLGAEYKGRKSGTFGKYGIYSFNGNKIITTSGGGMLVSNDKEAMERAKFLATQAKDPALHYQHSQIGYNYRMSNILAGIGRSQMEVIEERVEAKRWIFCRYEQELGEIKGINMMKESPDVKHNRWLTSMTIDTDLLGITPRALIEFLKEENIESRPIWKPLHLQPLLEQCAFFPHDEKGSISEKLFQTGICLPSGTNMDELDITRVIACIKRFISLNKEEERELFLMP
ncbi:aminotransferase class I/II-fold pyridoxal phosphate-dependent enzyme [Bacillus sp. 2205SS5-2]|uniref:aminotransferase class I/II-fold pyridoxal phosphate-dependent enzyme n=1 Tax=Bacillus sp. 2205SS5-2 TaxID=3109031 RepID=UPI003005CFA2